MRSNSCRSVHESQGAADLLTDAFNGRSSRSIVTTLLAATSTSYCFCSSSAPSSSTSCSVFFSPAPPPPPFPPFPPALSSSSCSTCFCEFKHYEHGFQGRSISLRFCTFRTCGLLHEQIRKMRVKMRLCCCMDIWAATHVNFETGCFCFLCLGVRSPTVNKLKYRYNKPCHLPSFSTATMSKSIDTYRRKKTCEKSAVPISPRGQYCYLYYIVLIIIFCSFPWSFLLPNPKNHRADAIPQLCLALPQLAAA